MKHQIHRAIPDFATHEGRTKYAHLLGLDDFPEQIHSERYNGTTHDDIIITERAQKARVAYKNLDEETIRIMKRYTHESRQSFDITKIRGHKHCSICQDKFVGAFHICWVCAHIFRSEIMIDKKA